MRHLEPGVNVIRRPTKAGIGWHYGVVEMNRGRQIIAVVDFVGEGGGTWRRLGQLEDFIQGGRWEVESHVPVGRCAGVAERWKMVTLGGHQFRYDLLEANCEHRANWLAHGVHRSGQVAWAMLVGAVVFVGLGLMAIARRDVAETKS